MNGKTDMKKAVAIIVAVVVLSLAEIATARNHTMHVAQCDGKWYSPIVDFATGEESAGPCGSNK